MIFTRHECFPHSNDPSSSTFRPWTVDIFVQNASFCFSFPLNPEEDRVPPIAVLHQILPH